jgi:hypothetical protein
LNLNWFTGRDAGDPRHRPTYRKPACYCTPPNKVNEWQLYGITDCEIVWDIKGGQSSAARGIEDIGGIEGARAVVD